MSAKEQKPAQEDRTILINFVLDKSGSMERLCEATISGFNEFLGDQRREGGTALMNLVLFDHRVETVATAVPVREMLELTQKSYVPGGTTALYDAIGRTMALADEQVAQHHPDQVLFVVMTDGLENASRTFDRERIFQMIEDRQRYAGFEFIYLGANQDSYDAGRSMGIADGRMADFAYSAAGAQGSMRRISHNVRAYRRDGGRRMDDQAFFSAEFEQAGGLDYDEYRRTQGDDVADDSAGAGGK